MINSRDINDLREDVRGAVKIFLARCEAAGMDVLITNTLRDDEYQAKLYAQGRTTPGSIVTNSKTTTFHGAGLAFDICKNVKGHEYDDLAFFSSCAKIGKEIGFSWGGDWKSFVDRPHFQWDNRGAGSYKKTPEMSIGALYNKLQAQACLADSTMDYLSQYKYGIDLIYKIGVKLK